MMPAVVEKVSTKQHGVKLDGRWFDWSATASLPCVGDYIEYTATGKLITYAALILPEAPAAGPGRTARA